MAGFKKVSFKRHLRVSAKFLLAFLLISSFQNCGQPFEANEQVLSMSSMGETSRLCEISNGQGQLNVLSQCEVVTCNAGYFPDKNLNTCVEERTSCSVANGMGFKFWQGTSWSSCQIQSCDNGFHNEENSCVSNVRNCSGTGAQNTQTWNGTSWGACTVSQCAAGSHMENNSCVSNIQSCSVAMGEGQRSWNGSAWNTCQAISCHSGSRLEGSTCVPENDNRSCNVNGKVGTQGLNSGVWSSCRVCDTDAYTSFRGICFDNPTFVKNYASFLPGCWSNGLLTCPVPVHSGFISVPSRYSIKPSESVTFSVFYMGSSSVSLSASHVQVSGPGSTGCTKSVSGSGSSVRTVTLSGCQGPGAVAISILSGSSTGLSGEVLSSFGPSSDVIVTSNLASVSYSLKTDGTYPGSRGNQIPYEMHYPANYASLSNIPIIVWVHGGGWTGGSAEIDRPLAQYFAELGFLVFNINYTLAPPSGVAFPNISLPATPYAVGPNDVKAFIDYLKANVHIMNGDTSKISIAGSSAGGHLALHQATRPDNSTQFRCVISVAGPSHLTPYKDIVNYPVTRAIMLNVFGDSTSFLNNSSPVYNASHFKGARLGVFHQLQDNLVPISHALELVTAIKKVKPATEVTLNYANETNPNPWINPTIAQVTHVYNTDPSSLEVLKHFVHTQCR